MIDYFLLFFCQYLVVFFLVMNSKLIRDDRWIIAMVNSLFISASQFTAIYLVANTSEGVGVYICGAIGASLGVASSHLFYTRYIFNRLGKGTATPKNV